MDEMAQLIRSRIDREQLVAALADWVRLETPSHDVEASAAIADRLAADWVDAGAVRQEPGPAGTHVVIDIPAVISTGKPVLLLGHSDTVWPVGTLAGAVPLEITDEVLRGPGSYDMKAGLVVMRTAMRVLAELGLAHPPVRVLIAADEEVGSKQATPFVRAAAEGVAAVFGFESPHPDGALKVGRLGSTRVRLCVIGREAHAALDPEKGISAIDELVDQLLVLRERLAAVQARRPGEILVNVGAITGGGRTNVVPGHAEALIGFRFATADAEAEVLAELSGLTPVRPGAELDVEVLSARPAWQAQPGDQALLAQVAAAAASVGLELAGRPAAGAADTNTTGALGVATLDGFGPRGAGAHAVNEHIVIDSLLDRVVLLAAALHALA